MIDTARWLRFGAMLTVAWVAGAGCSATGAEPRIDSSTHWLVACSDDSVCGDLWCLCGVCTDVCADDGACAEPSGDAVCAPAADWAGCDAPASGLCTDACTSASDCPSAAPACIAGACVATVGDNADAGADSGVSDAGGTGDGGGEACTEAECDPAPGTPSYECPDGSVAGPICQRGATGTCTWNFLQCPSVAGCFSDDECQGGTVCNAEDICIQDPSCPECDVCFGWCVSTDDTCDRASCGDGLATAGQRFCDDGSLAGPICGASFGGECTWVQTVCAEDAAP